MTRLAVVAFPLLDPHDRERLEGFRESHDPQASRLDGHFTLMFPADAEWAVVSAQVDSTARLMDPFEVVLHAARAVADQVAGGYHVFLVPEQGAAELRELHEALYSGSLRTHLREDVSFLPHVTVAAATSRPDCERLAEEAQTSLPIRAIIENLDVVEVSAAVRRLKTTKLGKGR